MKRFTNRNNLRKGFWGFFALTALFLFSSGCSVDRRLAKEFIASEDRPPVIIKEPKAVYLVSYKKTDADTSGLARWQIDSIRYHESEIVKMVDTRKFKAAFSEAFEKQFHQYGFQVYQGEEVMPLLENDSAHPLVIHFPQMELEEYIQPFTDVGYVRGREYYKNFDLDAVDLNTWLKLSVRGVSGQEFYFISDSITDRVEGRYYRDDKTQAVRYKYKYHDVTASDMYQFARDMGENYAMYVFDHYLNRFIDRNRKNKAPRRFMYHYNPKTESIMLIDDLPWIKMQSDEVYKKD